MWGPELSDYLEVVDSSVLTTHFAKSVVPWEGRDIAVILSLSRVCIFSSQLETFLMNELVDFIIII